MQLYTSRYLNTISNSRRYTPEMTGGHNKVPCGNFVKKLIQYLWSFFVHLLMTSSHFWYIAKVFTLMLIPFALRKSKSCYLNTIISNSCRLWGIKWVALPNTSVTILIVFKLVDPLGQSSSEQLMFWNGQCLRSLRKCRSPVRFIFQRRQYIGTARVWGYSGTVKFE